MNDSAPPVENWSPRRRRRPRRQRFNAVPLIITVALVVTALIGGYGFRRPHPRATRAQPRPAASPALQTERRQFIEKLQRERIIQKIDTPGTLPRVHVLPRFFDLRFEEKENFLGVCFAYVNELPRHPTDPDFQEADPMPVYDAMTNKRIGCYESSGLRLE